MRRTSVAGLIGLVYGICTGVILAAYHELGSPSLFKPSRFMAADATPAHLLPGAGILDDRIEMRAPPGQDSPITAVADAAPLTSPAGSAPLSDEIRPAMAPWPAGESVSGIESSAAADGPDGTRDAVKPGPAGDESILEAESMATAADLAWERSAAAAPEMASEADAAVQPQAASAVAQERWPPAITVAPPTPAFRPLDALTTVVAEAGPPAARGAPEAPRGAFTRSRPPKPSFKPVIVTQARPEPVREPSARAVAATVQTLPEALRAFWTNLKILLASAPASSDWRAERGGNGGGEASGLGSRRETGSAGPGNPRGGADGSSPGGGGGGASSGSDSRAGGGGSSASSGDDRGSVGSGGRGRGEGGRGGRGGRDRDDDDRGSRGDRGGRGDGDRGGRGNGRSGDDDDD